MMAYTALGQSIYLLAGPLIGRLYSPAEFGLYGLFYAFSVAAIGLVFLNYDFAIPAALSERDARRLTRGALLISLVLSPVAALIMTGLILCDLMGFGNLPFSAPLLLLALLLTQAVVQILQSWEIRRRQTLVIGKASVTLNSIRGAVQVGLGVVLPSWVALAAGEVLGRVGNAAHLAKRSDLLSGYRAIRLSWKEQRLTLYRYREFPLVLLPSQTIDGAVAFVQSAGVTYLFGPAGLGMFFLMRRTLDMPVAFVFRSLSDLFYERLAQDAREQPSLVRPFFIRSVGLIAGVGFTVGVPAMLVSPEIFAFIFGPEWREAGILAAIMAPAAILNLAVAPVARIFALTTRPYLRYWFSAVNLTGNILALSVSYWSAFNLTQATACLSIATSLAYMVYFAAGYVASGNLRTRTMSSAKDASDR
ncbi:hypothetical protein IC614_08700 [Allosphingosinicella flava]|uniref:Polysaccharide biosynthesis protein n=1 Tax=Allosphingosinicella flava TaxID=2771430 RepID=A0A7T2GIF5_9SPHN|nr:oligosaccharide flippase family protein [Sphingosinicella flava]QPQ54424.1 hypothetical protein IC614_08700 [Sphingosinicella flava]